MGKLFGERVIFTNIAEVQKAAAKGPAFHEEDISWDSLDEFPEVGFKCKWGLMTF